MKKYICLLILILATVANAETVSYLTDIRAVYIYDEPDNIDWSAVYYLSAENGCRIDLITFMPGPSYQILSKSASEYNLESYRYLLPDIARTTITKTIGDIFGDMPPDLVILGGEFSGKELKAIASYITGAATDTSYNLAIQKVYRKVSDIGMADIHINSRTYYSKYFNAFSRMATALNLNAPSDVGGAYSHYEMLFNATGRDGDKPSFLSGLRRFKFDEIVESNIGGLLPTSELAKLRDEYLENLETVSKSSGDDRIEALVTAKDRLSRFGQLLSRDYAGEKYPRKLGNYVESRLKRLSRALMRELNVDFSAHAELYNSSEGKRLKFKTELTNNGHKELYGGWIGYRLDGKSISMIDSGWIRIRSAGSVIKEYPVPIDPRNLEHIDLASILFIGKVKYENSVIEFEYTAAGTERETFSVEIIPDFILLQPFDNARVDKLAKQTKVKLIFNKPVGYTGVAKIDIRTPQFVKAGAFDETIVMNEGDRAIERTIPIVATKSLPKRLHEITVNIVSDGKALASDIVYLRQSEFSLAKVQGIGLFPDHEGLLEDIMIAGGAEYRVISNRLVKAGDFNLYSLLVFGTRFYENYTAHDLIRDKVKKYLENGGTVVVFGQPDDWNGLELPVSIIPGSENIAPGQINTVDKDNPIFKVKALVQPESFIGQVSGHYLSYPAVVYPGKTVIAYGNRSLLSVTEVGNGKLIYCGLPLLSMFRDLKTEAIDLTENIFSSSR